MEETIIGILPNHQHADEAVKELQDMGVNAKDISIAMKTPEEGESIGKNQNAIFSQGMVREIGKGAATGGVIGGLAGLLIGIAAVVVPGLGSLLFVGPLANVLGLTGVAATTLTGAFAGAATGGLVGVFEGIGVSKEDARIYAQQIEQGGVLVAVPASSSQEHQVEDILEKHAAQRIQTVAAGK